MARPEKKCGEEKEKILAAYEAGVAGVSIGSALTGLGRLARLQETIWSGKHPRRKDVLCRLAKGGGRRSPN